MRSFVAIELSQELRHSLTGIVEALSIGISPHAVRWVRAEGIHLTLKFLGDVAPGQMDEVRGVIQSVVPKFSAFTFSAGGVGCFPNTQHPRIIWVGIHEESGELAALQEALEQDLRACGFEREDRKFHPHLTLGRMRRDARQADYLAVGEAIGRAEHGSLGEFQANEVTLFRSDLKPTGAVYTKLAVEALQERP